MRPCQVDKTPYARNPSAGGKGPDSQTIICDRVLAAIDVHRDTERVPQLDLAARVANQGPRAHCVAHNAGFVTGAQWTHRDDPVSFVYIIAGVMFVVSREGLHRFATIGEQRVTIR